MAATDIGTSDARTATTPAPMGTMKAIIQEGTGSFDVLHLREIDRPVLEDDRVLVRVHAASLNAVEYHSVHGGWLVTVVGKLMRAKTFPIPGTDVSGVVEAVGKNVTGLKVGDEVFGGARGSYAEYTTGTEKTLLLKPRNMSFVEAAAVCIAGVTALQGLRDKGALKSGQRVLIHGAGGGVGTFAVQIAKALGAHVTAVTGPRNMEIVGGLGPDTLIDYTKEDITQRRDRYDVVVDIASTRPLGSMRRLVTPDGMLVLIGATKGGWMGIFARIIAAMFRARVLKQRIVFYVAQVKHDDLAFLKELMESGKLRPQIEKTYPLSETVEAFRYAGSGQARAKVVITVS
jgi:NADPH:quinone reductase-like Zn-dependent oxidoreductase